MEKEVGAIDSIANEIKAQIKRGEYAVGDKLPTEKELCEAFNVGRSTLREAIGMIRALGYIETRHGSGSYVIANSVDSQKNIERWFALKKPQLNDFFEVRCNVEVMNIKYAILRRTDEELDRIRLIHNSFENATMRGDAIKMACLDEHFHMELAKMSKNTLLIEFNQMIASSLRPYRMKSFSVPENAVQALIPHSKIIKALEEQDLQVGVQVMQEHMDISLRDIAVTADKFNHPDETAEGGQ